MEKIIIEATANTPTVILDPDRMMYEISGESRPKDSSKFFSPILQWLDELGEIHTELKDNKTLFEFNFRFEYFNSLSAKYILDICKKLSRQSSGGINICVKWYYETDDDDMHEVGKEMSRISKLPFEFIEIQPW